MADTTTTKTPPEWILKAIRSELDTAWEIEMKLFADRMEKRKAEIIASVMLHVEKNMRVETFGTTVRIEVQTKSV